MSVRFTAAVLALALVAGACAQTGVPPPAEDGSIPPPPPPAPLIVLLRRPGAAAAAGMPVRLESRVLAEHPVARLELWVDGELVEGRDVEEGGTEVGADWSWTPASGGVHAALLRAGDVDGRVMQSAPTWVRVTGPEGTAADSPSAAVVGAAGLRSALGAPAALLAPPPAPTVTVDGETCTAEVTVAAVDGASGIAVYAAPFGGGGFEAAGLLPPGGGTLAVPVGAGPVVVTAGAYDAAVEVPSAPVLVPPSPCAQGSWTGDVELTGGVLTAPDVDQAYLYVSTDGSSWDRLPAGDQAFVARGAGGRFDFSSALPAVQAGGSLFVEAWGRVNGGLRALGRGTYTAAEAPGGGEVAAGSPTFLLPKASLDWVAGKKLDSVSLKYCQGGDDCDILLREGDLCGEHVLGEKPKSTKDDAEWVGMFIAMCTPVSPAKTFRWKPTIVDGVTHGLVQVSVLPPPSGPALDFPGLVFTKPVAQVGGDFPVDLADVLFPKASVSGPLTYDQVVSLVPAGPPSPAGGAAAPAGGAAAVASGVLLSSPFFTPSPATAPASAAPPGEGASGGVMPVAVSPSVLYVRVVPMNGVQPVDDATNPVRFTIVPVTPSWYEKWKPKVLGGVTMTVTSALPPGLPNPKYGRCVRVTANPHGTENPAPNPVLKPFYDAFEPAGVGSTLCAVYSPPDDDWWDVISDAVDFVTDVWDAFSDLYGSLQSAVVNGVVSVTGCKPADICKTVVGGLINVGLAAVGVPPTIPKWQDVVAGAKGDLKSFVLTAMASSGVDCGVATIACETLAGELLDATLDEIEAHVSAAAVSAASSGDYYLYLASDITVVPEPVSAVQPAVWKVTFTRTAPDDPSDDVVEAKACTVWGSVEGHHPSHSWSDDAPPNQNNVVHHKNEPVSGLVMTGPSLTVDLASLAVGQSRSVTVLADTMNDWYPPGLEDGYLQGVFTWPQTWIFFQQGATLDLDLGTDCSASWSTTVAMDGTPATPQEYPYP